MRRRAQNAMQNKAHLARPQTRSRHVAQHIVQPVDSRRRQSSSGRVCVARWRRQRRWNAPALSSLHACRPPAGGRLAPP
eukprot:298332-Chlamydomonas_euryale.AAC.3